MKYLFEDWEILKSQLRQRDIMLFLDYDGTLVPITERPKRATISKETKKVLENLSKAPRCKLAIISGRSLEDIRGMVGLKDIIYSGNHGLEIEGPKIRFKAPVSISYATLLKSLKLQLGTKLKLIKGHIIEDKGLCLALHYRLVDKKYIPLLKTIFYETVLPYRAKGKIRVRSGKMLLEVRPPIEWDKGRVVLWLLARQEFALKKMGGGPVFPVYIGDDKTDEDAFAALKEKGLTIFVGGAGAYSAKYYLIDTSEVIKFLKEILELRKGCAVCLD